MKNQLSFTGQHLRKRIAKAGFEVTPDELSRAIDEAGDRVGMGCAVCNKPKETRFRVCFQCAFPAPSTPDTKEPSHE